MLRQIAVLGVWPATNDGSSFVDGVFLPGRKSLDALGLLTVAMDIPCRRSPPTLQRIWSDTADDFQETDLVENAIARLDALSRVGPMTIVTFGGTRRDWPTLKLAAIKAGTGLGPLFDLEPRSGGRVCEDRIELLDLALWLGGGALNAELGPLTTTLIIDRVDAVAARTAQLYGLFLRFLVITGRMSGPVYHRADYAVNSEIRRLKKRSGRNRPISPM
jgi:hypothetical protein